MATRNLVRFAAAVEGATGLALTVSPPTVSRLLLGQDVSGAGLAVGRVAGLALLSLGVACWPARDALRENTASLRAMLSYNLLITLYLFYLGVGGELAGKLLWPAFVLHAVMTILLVRARFNGPAAAHQC